MTMEARKGLQNHTDHITKFKKTLELAASKREVREIAEKVKKCASNTSLIDLYNKTVPHVATMESIGQEMAAEVERLAKIVA